MKKIGIVTFHRAHNYGAILQAYALEKFLEEIGNEVEFVDYFPEKMKKQYGVIKINEKNFFTRVKSFLSSIVFLRKNRARYDNFNNFINKNIKMTQKYHSIEEVKKNPPKDAIYITGSDQVWNPDITNGLSDIYTLNFGEKNTLRVAYAASIGKNTLGNERYQKKLAGINYISVREETAKNLLTPILKQNITVVLDPTLLFEGKKWQEKLNLKKVENIPYILAYQVKENKEYLNIVNELSRRTGLKIIHFDKKNTGYNNILKNAYQEDPEGFVRLIKNAEYVVTTSFHATVFSILFHKKFFVIPHKSTGSRVTDLLDKLEINDRIFYSLDEFKKVDYEKNVNYESVEKRLEIEREKSIEFIMKATIEDRGEKNE